MKTPKLSMLRRMGVAVTTAGAIAGCSSMGVQQQTIEQTEIARMGPQAAPFRSITGFSNALRCMDNLMIDYGVRDVSMLVEDILDQTKKVNAGTRDMLISAISDMTRRSRAIRVVAFARDTTNIITFLNAAQRKSAYEEIPRYDIKGSISQFDDNMIRNQKDAGIGFQPFINLGLSSDATSSILGLDLSVLTTRDLSVLAGVTSRNAVAILKTGRSVDGDANYHKFGLTFSMSLSKSEGQSQALRGLVELAVIELMGKLTKTPYWTCLGADPKLNEDIRLEMSDWYFAMAASRVELIGYFQNQLLRRGFYQGPIDGEFNPAIDAAIGNYRAALGMSNKALLDEEFFIAFLNADHTKVKAPEKSAELQQNTKQAAPVPAAQTAATPAPAAEKARTQSGAPLRLTLSTANGRQRFERGEAINLLVKASSDSFVYCYLQDETSKVTRFFPNRFSTDARVPASATLALPGTASFNLFMNTQGVKETIACFATPRDVLKALPAQVVGRDLEPLPVASIDTIRDAFKRVSSGSLAQEIFHVNPAK